MDNPPSGLLGDRSVTSTVADVAAAALADFFCLQQTHPIITSTETASVKARRVHETCHKISSPCCLMLYNSD